MISNISSLADTSRQTSLQTAPATQNQSRSDPAQASKPQPLQSVQDSIEISAAGLAAVQSTEAIISAANAGDPIAIAIIQRWKGPA
jgi:hypothetical protein